MLRLELEQSLAVLRGLVGETTLVVLGLAVGPLVMRGGDVGRLARTPQGVQVRMEGGAGSQSIDRVPAPRIIEAAAEDLRATIDGMAIESGAEREVRGVCHAVLMGV